LNNFKQALFLISGISLKTPNFISGMYLHQLPKLNHKHLIQYTLNNELSSIMTYLSLSSGISFVRLLGRSYETAYTIYKNN
jgi:hypothetical protein